MAITKRGDDLSVLNRPINVMDRFLDEMWRDPFRALTRAPSLFDDGGARLGTWRPSTDIEETKNAYIVRIDLPGMSKKDVHVSLDDNVLRIWGEKKREGSEKNDDFRVMERYYGQFERSFVLPKGIDANSINAEFKEGVLTVNVQKSEESMTREISIK